MTVTQVIFDFDSTIIRCESLEEILRPRLEGDSAKMAQIEEITRLGMEGAIDFKESLSRRLALAQPNLSDLERFGREGTPWLTSGMEGLIASLHRRGLEVWIVSGGLREAIVPVAAHLGIPAERVLAVRLQWRTDGSFAGIDPGDRFSVSKVDGCRAFFGPTDRPRPIRIGVGDGMTDFALFDAGLVDCFIAYTEHVRRPAVVATGQPEASDTNELARLLEEYR